MSSSMATALTRISRVENRNGVGANHRLSSQPHSLDSKQPSSTSSQVPAVPSSCARCEHVIGTSPRIAWLSWCARCASVLLLVSRKCPCRSLDLICSAFFVVFGLCLVAAAAGATGACTLRSLYVVAVLFLGEKGWSRRLEFETTLLACCRWFLLSSDSSCRLLFSGLCQVSTCGNPTSKMAFMSVPTTCSMVPVDLPNKSLLTHGGSCSSVDSHETLSSTHALIKNTGEVYLITVMFFAWCSTVPPW